MDRYWEAIIPKGAELVLFVKGFRRELGKEGYFGRKEASAELHRASRLLLLGDCIFI